MRRFRDEMVEADGLQHAANMLGEAAARRGHGVARPDADLRGHGRVHRLGRDASDSTAPEGAVGQGFVGMRHAISLASTCCP